MTGDRGSGSQAVDTARRRITLLCVDDHRIVREGLRMILNGEPDMTVIETAATGTEVVARFRQHSPDITLMDLRCRT